MKVCAHCTASNRNSRKRCFLCGEYLLKACPFCGKTNTVILWQDEEDVAKSWLVSCNVNTGGCGGSTGYKNTIKEAIDAWERRSE